MQCTELTLRAQATWKHSRHRNHVNASRYSAQERKWCSLARRYPLSRIPTPSQWNHGLAGTTFCRDGQSSVEMVL